MIPSPRVRWLNFFFLFVFGAIVVRLGYWQFGQAEVLAQAGQKQYVDYEAVSAQRGLILARDQYPLVGNETVFELAVATGELDLEKAELVAKLAPLLAQPDEEVDEWQAKKAAETSLEDRLGKEAKWITLANGLDRDTRLAIEDFDLDGLYFQQDQRRIYPEGTASAHLAGFVGYNEEGERQGYFGLEGHYDRELKGRDGLTSREKDAAGRPIIFGLSQVLNRQVDGRTLVTSLDRTVTHLVFEKLVAGVERFGAKSGTATVMDPATGEILAMVSWPGYDPARYNEFEAENHLNPVISSTYEPGSTFKPLVMAAVLDSGAVDPETKCKKCAGPREISGFQINTSEGEYFPNSTMTEVLIHSDNVGMVWAGEQISFSDLYRYLERFGLGQETGIDLQGEEEAPLRAKKDWYPIDQATLTFGQGIAVTRLQILRSIGAIGNHGRLVAPRVVTGLLTEKGLEEFEAKPAVQVISEETAHQLTKMMVKAVDQGHAGRHKPEGFVVAGKTGTAQIAVEGEYDEDKTIASFVGFAPASAPKFVMLVTLTEPTASTWGSETATPIWFEIAQELFWYYGILPGQGGV